MVKPFLKYRAALIAALFIIFNSTAQENISFPDFKAYNKVGFTISPVYYSAAKTTRYYGEYTLNNYKTLNLNFGFDYLINPENKWAFKTGLHLDMVPLYNFKFTIKEGDLWENLSATSWSEINRYKLNFTIPVMVQVKKQLAYNVYFSLEAGLHIMIMQEGNFDVSYIFSNDDETESREVFAMYADTQSPVALYPNAVVSPGIYIMLHGILLEGNVVYQQPIIPFFKGEYQFGNFFQSAPTKGSYTLSGGYIGLSFTVHLKKKRKTTS